MGTVHKLNAIAPPKVAPVKPLDCLLLQFESELEPVRTYVRGNCLPAELQANLTAAGLKQYWLVDAQGMPVGKPFQRRRDIELHEKTIADRNYEIIARPREKRSKVS